MRELRFTIHTCGMSEETFSEQIMIYRPTHTKTKVFSQKDLDSLGIVRVSELVEYIKQDDAICEILGEWGLENICTATIYIQHQNYLLGLLEDKTLSDIFNYFSTERLEFVFFIVGGASIHNETDYRFTVHPNEDVHRHMPHVHVLKDGVEIRYSLETLQPIDLLVNPHKRDNKKIIMPFLEKNQEKLMGLWRLYMDGYTSPAITQEGQQFYAES